MKRPFAVIGITYLLSQAVAACFGTAFTLAAGITVLLGIFLCFFGFEKRNKTLIAVLITICVAMFALFAYTKIYVESVIPAEGKVVQIKGRIVEEPYENYGRFYYVIKTDSIAMDGVRQKTKIRLSSSVSLDAEYSDVFEGTVHFTSISDENSFASHRRLLSKGITATAFLMKNDYYTVSDGNGGIYSFAVFMRNKLKSSIRDLYPDETGEILSAMMTGDESDVDSDIVNAFRNTGMAHVLAVSGLHLTLIASAITWFLRRFYINRKIIAVIVCVFIWFYAAVAGFPMSSLRAAIMITIMLIGIIADRLHSPLNSLGIAILIICLVNPYAAIDAGLIMSFSSTFGLIEVAPKLNKYVQKYLFKNRSGKWLDLAKDIVSIFVTSFTASIFILPASVLYFGKISLLSPVTNTILVSVSVLFLGIGFVAVLLSLFGNIGSFIAYPFMTIDWFIGKILLQIIKFFDSIPGTVINTGKNTVTAVFGCILIAVLFIVFFRSSKNRKHLFIICSFCCSMIVFVWFMSARVLNDRVSISVFDTGKSVMVLAKHESSSLLIGDGGDDYDLSLVQYDLQDQGISEITALIMTDLSEDSSRNMDALVNNLNPEMVFIPNEKYHYDEVKYHADIRSVPIELSLDKKIEARSVSSLSVEDHTGLVWTRIYCDNLSALICPDGGDGLYCPFEIEEYDAVIFSDNIPVNLTALQGKTYIVCSEYDSGSIITSQIKARGLKNVYCTGVDGKIEITSRDGRLYIGSDN